MLPEWIANIEGASKTVAALALIETKHALRFVSNRTGLPVIVIAVLAVVFAWRVGRRTWHVVFELALAFGVLFAATKLGWIPW